MSQGSETFFNKWWFMHGNATSYLQYQLAPFENVVNILFVCWSSLEILTWKFFMVRRSYFLKIYDNIKVIYNYMHTPRRKVSISPPLWNLLLGWNGMILQ